MDAEPPEVLIVAGPNGAGKTTFALEIIGNEIPDMPFINADVIAAELNPDHPEAVAVQAGRQMFTAIGEQVENRASFCIETTLSGKAWVRRILDWKKQGYKVTLIYLKLQSALQSKKRVAARVQHGGHNIPPEDIERRFEKGLRNFHDIYKPIVDDWYLYDNAGKRKLLESKNDEPDA